jgi:hypothetical protein
LDGAASSRKKLSQDGQRKPRRTAVSAGRDHCPFARLMAAAVRARDLGPPREGRGEGRGEAASGRVARVLGLFPDDVI